MLFHKKYIYSILVVAMLTGCSSKSSVNAGNDSYLEVVEDIAGNANGTAATAAQINAIDGVSGAIDGVDYATALAAGTYTDPANPTAAEIQAVIDIHDVLVKVYAPDGHKTWGANTKVSASRNGSVITGQIDLNGNGTVDQVYTATVDADNHIVHAEKDLDPDGTVDESIDYTTNAKGNVLTMLIDSGNNGTVNEARTYTLDEEERITKKEADTDNDGNLNYIYTANSFYADGDVKELSLDLDADGIKDRIYTYAEYTTPNKKTKLLYLDMDADGTVDRIYAYVYDDRSLLDTFHLDMDADGTADRSYSRTYDIKERLITQSLETDYDGNINAKYTYAYMGSKRVTVLVEYDTDDDGTFDKSIATTYDANGTKETVLNDNDYDGNIDKKTTYNDKGLKIKYENDSDDDGTMDLIATYAYNTADQIVTTSYDTDADGTVDMIYTFIYDSAGLHIRSFIDTNADGIDDKLYYYINNASAQFSVLVMDYDYQVNTDIEYISLYRNDSVVLANLLQDNNLQGVSFTGLVNINMQNKGGTLTMDKASLESFSPDLTAGYELRIKGGANDTVVLNGATTTGNTVTYGTITYDEYTYDTGTVLTTFVVQQGTTVQ